MKYALLIYENEARYTDMPKEVYDAEMAEYYAFGDKYKASLGPGEALEPTRTATTVRVRDGKTLTTDGPFAETKEQLGGFYIVDAASLDEAITIAADIPGARNGSVEIRPVMVFE